MLQIPSILPGIFKRDSNAFLFFQEDHLDSQIVKMPIKADKCDYAIRGKKGLGPTFGDGKVFYDIKTFDKVIVKNNEGYFDLNGHVSLGGVYDQDSIESKKMSGGTMEVKDLEVYQIQGMFTSIIYSSKKDKDHIFYLVLLYIDVSCFEINFLS